MNTKDTLIIATSVAAVGAFAVLTLTSTDETTREGSGSPAEGFTAGELPEAGCHFTRARSPRTPGAPETRPPWTWPRWG